LGSQSSTIVEPKSKITFLRETNLFPVKTSSNVDHPTSVNMSFPRPLLSQLILISMPLVEDEIERAIVAEKKGAYHPEAKTTFEF
jgi:hypothetical protein